MTVFISRDDDDLKVQNFIDIARYESMSKLDDVNES
jgi:hypothetical protein